MASLTAFITAFNEFASLATKLWGLYKQAKLNGWINEGRELAVKIDGAKTDEERQKLAQDLFNHRA